MAAARFVVLDGEEQQEGEQTSEWEREAIGTALGFASPMLTRRRGTRSRDGRATRRPASEADLP
jgi:hypothetical protein